MPYTKFGELFRILRIKHHEVLADAKEFLGVSTAFISSVECGKKSVPDDWAEKISEHYRLSNKEREELIDAIGQSKKSMRIDLSSTSELKKRLLFNFKDHSKMQTRIPCLKSKEFWRKGKGNDRWIIRRNQFLGRHFENCRKSSKLKSFIVKTNSILML